MASSLGIRYFPIQSIAIKPQQGYSLRSFMDNFELDHHINRGGHSRFDFDLRGQGFTLVISPLRADGIDVRVEQDGQSKSRRVDYNESQPQTTKAKIIDAAVAAYTELQS